MLVDRQRGEQYGQRGDLQTRAVDMAIAVLRKKLETDPGKPTVIVSVMGWFALGMVGGKLADAADGLGLDGLRAVDGAVEFRAAEGDDGEPAEDDDGGEGDEGFHGRGISCG